MGKKKTEINIESAKRLKKCIKDSGLTQIEISRRAYCSQQQLSWMVNAKRPITTDSASALAPVLGVSVGYLLCETDYKNDNEIRHFMAHGINDEYELIQQLAELHGYKRIGDSFNGDYKTVKIYKTLSQEDILKEIAFSNYDIQIILEDCSGHQIQIDFEEYYRVIEEIGEYIDFKMSSLMKTFDGTVAQRLHQQTKKSKNKK